MDFASFNLTVSFLVCYPALLWMNYDAVAVAGLEYLAAVDSVLVAVLAHACCAELCHVELSTTILCCALPNCAVRCGAVRCGAGRGGAVM